MLNLQIKDAQSILKQKHRLQTVNFQNFNRNLIRLTTQQQKKKLQTDAINFIDDILDEDNPFRNIDTEDIWIEDGYLTISIHKLSRVF